LAKITRGVLEIEEGRVSKGGAVKRKEEKKLTSTSGSVIIISGTGNYYFNYYS
jgi:hypothetical protein